ncbi:amino acid carrier 1 [Haematococcus lacustris]|uniref:Amino acid carrier 1 n=1 Tax=Haematococcus lacustris TaxID=44745 RepID=A0A699YTH9_HAELA|nr:amino acid carrier 1 [Haematococcus lacustris]
MSVWALVDSYSTQGLAYGGPVAVIWGWVLVSCFSMAIALCMAELVSAFPTSADHITKVAFTACLEVALTHYIAAHVRLYTTGRHEEPGYDMTTQELLGVFTALHVVHAVLNSLGQSATRVIVVFSGWWNTVATLGFCAMLLWVAPKHQSLAFVFTQWLPGSEASGITSPPYIFMMGVLMSQWCLLGYDSCIHMCEEVVDAGNSACWSLVASVAAACLMGLLTLLSLTFSLQSQETLFNPVSASGGNGVAQLTWDVFKARYGTGHGALLPLCLPSVALFCCACTSMTANGRMVYAFSRDGAMLGSRWWRQLSSRTQQPVAGVWLVATLAFCIGLPAVLLPEMEAAVAAVSVLALTLSYALPLAFRAGQGSDAFIPGPGISLGRWGRPLAAVCCVYITFVCAVFCLPFAYPITLRNANWSAAAILLLLAFALTLW